MCVCVCVCVCARARARAECPVQVNTSMDSKHNDTVMIPRPTWGVAEAITACGAQDRFVQTSYDGNIGGYMNLDAYGPPSPPQIPYTTYIFGHGTLLFCYLMLATSTASRRVSD